MLKTLFKLIFAVGIIVWLFKRGHIDFSMVPKSLEHPELWAACIALIMLNAILCSFRWRLLLHIKSDIKIPILEVAKTTWIGMFFSALLPGAVTGDFLKLLYAKDLNPKLSKTYLLTSIFMDRFIGLLGLLFHLSVFTLITYSEVVKISPAIKPVLLFNIMLFLAMLGGLTILFIPESLQEFTHKLLVKIPVLGERISKTAEQIWYMGKDKVIVAKCLCLALVGQGGFVFGFWLLISPFLTSPMPISYAFTFIPLGLITIAIPISPSGLGVGHAIFKTLFGYFGVANGASLFNLFFIAGLFVNLGGSIPYLFSGKKHSLQEAEELEHEEETKEATGQPTQS